MRVVDGPNGTQIELWNGPIGRRWAANQERLDRSLAQVTDALFAAAAPQPGERVLDVGCGCGTTTLELARRTGALTAGIDVSAPMLAVARDRAAGDPNIRFVEDDAASHTFVAKFELLFSRFGVMFFADPTAAFANLRHALVPAGRVAFVCFRSLSENAWARVPLDAARDLVQFRPPDPNAPGPFSFAGSGRVREVLAHAGYREIRVDRHDCELHMGPTLDAATEHALDVGPLGRLVDGVDADTRARIAERVSRALEPYHREPTGIDVGMAVWIASARA